MKRNLFQKEFSYPNFRNILFATWLLLNLFCGSPSLAQEKASPVEINGDQVDFSMKENKVVAKGHVSVQRQEVTLLCDQMEYYHDTKLAIAQGNVVLIRNKERLTGDRMEFNFETMSGDFTGVKVSTQPYFGTGTKIARLADGHLSIEQGAITTCDLDKPHYRLLSKKIDIYPGEKATARNVRLLVGKMPMLYLPKFTQDLKAKEPAVLYTPGYDSDWGPFLVSQWRYQLNKDVKGVVHVDYRFRKGIGSGVDANYSSARYGEGIIRTYYIYERNIEAQHFFDNRDGPVTYRERFRGQWRHKWNIDERTNAIWQYYKLSDKDFLEEYFKREYESDSNPSSYFVLTRGLPLGTLSFQTDVRVNRFEPKLEKLPEISLDLQNRQIAQTGLFFKNTTIYSNFTKKEASPSEDRKETMRVDTDNEISYPMKVSFLELKPFIGGRETYYSKTRAEDQYNIVRGIFRTGADLSTKFYKIYDINTNLWNLNINRLRHILTPSVAYLFQPDPTVPSSTLDEFDSIDIQNRSHGMRFGLEQKLQTKRNLKSVDLMRVAVNTDFKLKEDLAKGGFNNVTSEIDIVPYSWLSLYFDSEYDTIDDRLKTANVDLYINENSKDWYMKFSKRLNTDVDDQVTTELGYTINPKWKFRTYQRFDVASGTYKEQEYGLVRDLHCWTMEFNFNHTRGEGDEIWLVFTSKAFPDLGFDFGTGFNQRKPGSATTE
jgi:LPS-assembly protein